LARDFCHLHLHTQYSFLDGAIRIADLFPRLKQLGMKSCAITDHGVMYGAADFFIAAKAADIKPILGMEAYVAGERGRQDRTVRESYHLVLLAETPDGLRNLVQLSTKAYQEGFYYVPRVDQELLAQHHEGIIALSACMSGEVARRFLDDDVDGARTTALEYDRIFGRGNYFLEVQPNGMAAQDRINAFLGQLSQDSGIPLIATNDCHYLEAEHFEAQDVLMCIRQQRPVDDPKRHRHETNAYYVRSGDEMWDLVHTDFAPAFDNALSIAERCNAPLKLSKPQLPQFPVPPDVPDAHEFVRRLAREGLERRFSELGADLDRSAYRQRLEYELGTITSMDFSGYFLIVQDFINEAKRRGVRVGPGRGSGAGSLVAYALRITDIDPIPYALLFERFLNPERISMPDFDIDFMQERRGEVIEYVTEKYGKDRVAQIATYAALNAKSVIKDVARVLGVPFAEVNPITKLIPSLVDGKKVTLEQALKLEPRLVEIQKENPIYAKIITIARILEGLFRQAGMHAAGVVIGQQPLTEYCPLFVGTNGEQVSQFDMKKVEKIGLVKFDFLGLKTLDVIDAAERHVNARILAENELTGDALEMAAQRHPHARQREPGFPIPPLDCSLLNFKEPLVYDLITGGETLGVFQLESTGFQELMRKLKPDCFEDIIASVALYRPGPIQAGMINDYVDRKNGRARVTYPHPLLETVLKPTYGTIVYQEQVMQIAQVMAGYTLGGADVLRRAMGKKQKEEMEAQRPGFVDGAAKNGIAGKLANEVFDLVDKFAGYGFNKSHSAAYAAVTYQTAYLKAFYPVEFMAALLTTEVGSTDNIVKYTAEARRMGIEVLSPDVNLSRRSFSIERPAQLDGTNSGDAKIRFGLSAVKGLGDAALDAIVDERDRSGSFKSLFELCERVPLTKINKKVLEALAHSGAMDGFKRSRAQLSGHIERAIESAQPLQKSKAMGQETLFGLFSAGNGRGNGKPGGSTIVTPERYELIEEWPERERLLHEKESLGFYLTGHPLDGYRDSLTRLASVNALSLGEAQPGSEVTVAGVVTALREKPMKDGSGRWAIVTFEDLHGCMELRVFSKVYALAEPLLKGDEPLLIKGSLMINDDDEAAEPKLRVDDIQLLAKVRAERTRAVVVQVPAHLDDAQQTLSKLRQILLQHAGKTPVRMVVLREGHSKTMIDVGATCRVAPSDELQHAICRLLGKDAMSFV